MDSVMLMDRMGRELWDLELEVDVMGIHCSFSLSVGFFCCCCCKERFYCCFRSGIGSLLESYAFDLEVY